MTSSNTVIRIKKPNRGFDLEQLQTKTQEELIEKIKSLQAHNEQLRNIMAKDNMKSKKGHNSKSKPFNFDKVSYRHVLLKFYYLGWDYKGYTVQEDTFNTIEYHLFQALLRTCLIKNRESSNYHRCGRTDKGVSSFSQTISIDLRSKLSQQGINENKVVDEIDYCKVINKLLPDNIQCICWAPIASNYSARFDCTWRKYKYFFPKGQLDIASMKTASNFLIGVHDFRNLCKMDVGNGVTNFCRNIMEVDIELECDNKINEFSMYVLSIKGKAFLWHQIRCIMGLLFLIGSGKEQPEIINELFDVENNPRKPDYNLANEIPLNLYECNYDLETDWNYDHDNLCSIITKLKSLWTQNSIKTVMTQSMICDLMKINKKIGYFGDIGDFTETLLQGVKSKRYVSLLNRNKCDSLEDKIDHYIKRQRIEMSSSPSKSEEIEVVEES